MRRTSSGKWKKIKRVSASGEQYQSAKVTGTVYADYYSVQAYSKTKDGKYIYSGYDKGFTHKNHKYGNKRVLYIGDSITKGSPYTGSERTNYAYPNRIQQLTGVEFFNESIPGATLQYSGSTRGHCIVNSVVGMIAEGRDTEFAFIQTKVGKNRSADKTIDVNSAAVQALLARYGLAPAVSGSDDPDQPDPGMEQNDANNDAADNDSDGLTVYEDL